MGTYQQLAVMGPTVIIGDFNAARTMDNRGGRPTPDDTAVKMAMHHWNVQDLMASLQGQASHQPRNRNRAPQIHASTYAMRTRHK